MLRSLLCASLVLAMACGGSPRRVRPNGQGQQITGPVGGTQVTGPSAPTGAVGTPRERLERVEAFMTQNGYNRVGPAIHNNNAMQGSLIAYAVDPQPGNCYVAVAVATEQTDLNLFVLDPAGQGLNHDVLANESPWVQVCPTTPGRHIVRLQMLRGNGEFYYALYQGPQGSSPQLASVLSGGSPAAINEAPVAQMAEIDAETQGRLIQMDEALSRSRYRRVGEPEGMIRAANEDYIRELNLQQGVCYAFASLGGPGTRDTDLTLRNQQGETLEQDRGTDIDGRIQFCPTQGGRYSLVANLYSGNGPVFVAGWVQEAQSAQPQNNNGQVMGNTSEGETVDQRYALTDADMQARGYESYGEPVRGSLGSGQNREFPIELEGGKCYAIVAIGASSVRNVDLALHQGNRYLDREVATDSRAIVRVCAEDTGTYSMQMTMAEGEGAFIYHAYRWPRGTRGPFGLAGLIYVRLGEVSGLLGVDGYEPDLNIDPDRGSLRREGMSASHRVPLQQGQCVAIAVVGGDGVQDLNAQLSRGGQLVAGDDSRNASPTIRYCAEAAGNYDLQVQAAAGQGDYFYQVFSRGQ